MNDEKELNLIEQNNDPIDEEFIKFMLEIEQKYVHFKKHDKIRIEQWTKKLCQVTSNSIWKKNRNLYAKLLLQNVLSRSLNDPFNKGPPEGPLAKLNKVEIKNKPSAKILKPNNNSQKNFFSTQPKHLNDSEHVSNSKTKIETQNLFENKNLLTKINEFFKKHETILENLDGFKEIKNELDQNYEDNSRLESNPPHEENKTEDFDRYIKDAYSETKSFLEKLEGFKQKTESLKHEIEISLPKTNGSKKK